MRLGRGCGAGGGGGGGYWRGLELGEQQPGAVLGGAGAPVGAAQWPASALLLQRHGRVIGGGGRHLVCVRVPGPGESAARGDAALVRRELGARGVLGGEPDRVGARWHGESTLHGAAAGGGTM